MRKSILIFLISVVLGTSFSSGSKDDANNETPSGNFLIK